MEGGGGRELAQGRGGRCIQDIRQQVETPLKQQAEQVFGNRFRKTGFKNLFIF